MHLFLLKGRLGLLLVSLSSLDRGRGGDWSRLGLQLLRSCLMSSGVLPSILVWLSLSKKLMLLLLWWDRPWSLLLCLRCHLKWWLHCDTLILLLPPRLYLHLLLLALRWSYTLKQMAFLRLKLVNLRLHFLKLNRHLVAFLHTSLKLFANVADNLLRPLNLLISIICRTRCAASALWNWMLFEMSSQLFVWTNELADSRKP